MKDAAKDGVANTTCAWHVCATEHQELVGMTCVCHGAASEEEWVAIAPGCGVSRHVKLWNDANPPVARVGDDVRNLDMVTTARVTPRSG